MIEKREFELKGGILLQVERKPGGYYRLCAYTEDSLGRDEQIASSCGIFFVSPLYRAFDMLREELAEKYPNFFHEVRHTGSTETYIK